MITTLIALPYEIARLPLRIVDTTLGDRLPEASGARVALDRAIGTTDRLAGSVLRNPALTRRGADRLERTDKVLLAARLEEEADAKRARAQQSAAAGRDEAARKRRAAQQRATDAVDEAKATEVRGKQQAHVQATRTAEAKKSAAADKASSRKSAVEQRKDRAETAAQAKKRAAVREAKAEIDQARETKQEAEQARSDADQLVDLAEARKKARKES